MNNVKVSYPMRDELHINRGNPIITTDKFRVIKIFMTAFVATLIIAIIFAFLILTLVYQRRLCFNTIINGVNVSNMSLDEAYTVLARSMKNYYLEVVDKDGSVTYINQEDAGLTVSYEKAGEFIESALKEQSLMNFFNVKEHIIHDLAVIDRTQLLSYTQGLELFNPHEIIPSQDAYLKFDESLGKYIVQEDVLGNMIKDDFVDILEAKLLNYERVVNLLEEDLYIPPKIKSDNETLIHNSLLYNAYLMGDYVIDMSGGTEILTVNQYYDWFVPNYLDAENADEESNEGESDALPVEDSGVLRKINPDDPFTIDKEKLSQYVKALYSQYNTFGARREFVTNGGKTIKLTQGDYGWWLNSSETSARIKDVLLNRDPTELEAVYYQKAAQRGVKDYGNSYVEIDLSKQYLWLYMNGKLVLESPVVTGKPSAGYATPPGIYSVTYKQRKATLNGPGYSTPVDYWMPFNKNVGLHDATWQPSFGGDRYLTNGSHGCINLPYDIAKNLYSYLEKEFPVVLYH